MATGYIIDYGAGNLLSLSRALMQAGFEKVNYVSSPIEIKNAGNLILPGVGSFYRAMTSMERQDVNGVIAEKARAGAPLLGICLGMQMLSDQGCENGFKKGLGLIPGKIESMRDGFKTTKVPVPVIGWMKTRFVNFESMYGDGGWFYYVHSYEFNVESTDNLSGGYIYHNKMITACVSKENIVGVQFHPEKSGMDGILFLENYRKNMSKD